MGVKLPRKVKNKPGYAAQKRAEHLRPVFAELTSMSARQAAEELNKRAIEAPAGGKWLATQVIRVRDRLARAPRVR